MNYNFNNDFKPDINECTSRGACSIAPNIVALQEIIFHFFKQLSYYIVKLESLGANNSTIKYQIITDIASLVTINEFNEKQMFSILVRNYMLYENTKKAYVSMCSEQDILSKTLKNIVNFNIDDGISKAISQGEKLFLNYYNKFSSAQKNYTSILRILIKSVALNLVKLYEFDKFNDDAYHNIIESLNIFNHGKLSLTKLKEQISILAEINNVLQKEVSRIMLEKFEGISKTTVSHSTTSGKAVLVSGNNFIDLLSILELTKDKKIDVYTHSNLLISHALNKFKKYPQLKGHYGDTTESCILDFATFPGAILLTKNSKNYAEYLYRGRLFSNDYFVPQGVIKIENNDYTPVIDSALNAKGFSKGKIKPSTTLGFDQFKLDEIFEKIIKKLELNEIKKLFIIGLNPYSEVQKEYFKTLFENIYEDEYIINFSSLYGNRSNIFDINVGNYTPLATNVLYNFFQKYSIESSKIVFFFADCDVITMSNIIFLKNKNTQNIYMAECAPTIINPNVFKFFINEYDIKITQNVQQDLVKIRQDFV